jgi:hypothetical protein
MIPDDWCKGIIKPLHKSGSIYDLDNYRGITLTSNVNKVFSKILETLILDFLESNNILGETQGPGALPILRLFKAFVIDSFVKTIENILSP